MKELTMKQLRTAKDSSAVKSDRPAIEYEGELYCGKCLAKLEEDDPTNLREIDGIKRFSCPRCYRGYMEERTKR